jgi:hypothetical protein
MHANPPPIRGLRRLQVHDLRLATLNLQTAIFSEVAQHHAMHHLSFFYILHKCPVYNERQAFYFFSTLCNIPGGKPSGTTIGSLHKVRAATACDRVSSCIYFFFWQIC